MHLSSAPAWSFQTRQPSRLRDSSPGPGSYDPIPSKFQRSPSYKIGRSPRQQQLTPTSVPGPGSYNPVNSKFSNTSGGAMGLSSRTAVERSVSPGPGAYDVNRSFLATVGGIIGRTDRNSLNLSRATPGPGTYEFRSKALEGPKFSMRGRESPKSRERSPGPGSYNTHLNDFTVKQRQPSYRMGSANRLSRQSSERSPGPGRYSARFDDSGPKWGFGNGNRIDRINSTTPGPGAYLLPDLFDRKGYTMTGRRPETAKSYAPGPGAYNPPSDRLKSPSWSVSRAGRASISRRDASPGPGSYSPCSQIKQPSAVFGTSERASFTKLTRNPGPGQYTISLRDSSPAYSMRPKTANIKSDNFPGPGHYSPNRSHNNSGWSLGNQLRSPAFSSQHLRSTNGPGSYYIDKGFEGPIWSFTKALRSNDNKNANPGPGAYNIFSSIANLPSYASRNLKKY